MLRTLLSTMLVTTALTGVADAAAPTPTPIAVGAARPLVVNRSIFSTVAQPKPQTTATGMPMNALQMKTLPIHRKPIAAPPGKGGSSTGQGSGGKNAAPALPINRSLPLHRQTLGW